MSNEYQWFACATQPSASLRLGLDGRWHLTKYALTLYIKSLSDLTDAAWVSRVMKRPSSESNFFRDLRIPADSVTDTSSGDVLVALAVVPNLLRALGFVVDADADKWAVVCKQVENRALAQSIPALVENACDAWQQLSTQRRNTRIFVFTFNIYIYIHLYIYILFI